MFNNNRDSYLVIVTNANPIDLLKKEMREIKV